MQHLHSLHSYHTGEISADEDASPYGLSSTGNAIFVNNEDQWCVLNVLLSTKASHTNEHSLFVLGLDIAASLIAGTSGNFTKLIEALTKAALLETLNTTVPFTLLAPDNTVINNQFPGEEFDNLLKGDKTVLANILKYHLLNGRVSTAIIRATNLPNQWNTSAASNAIVDKTADNRIKVNAATITEPEVTADNGLIHVIDKFLMPLKNGVDTLALAGTFKNFTAMLTAADLLGILRSDRHFTVFAPTDVAFAKLPTGVLAELQKVENRAFLTEILKYHMVAQLLTSASINRLPPSNDILMLAGVTAKLTNTNGVIKVNDLATVAPPELFSINGMIHSVDTVLLPPLDIVEAALISGKFTTLISVLGKAGLVNTLKGIGPFTLFAPNDDAFAKLSKTELDDLLNPDNKEKLSNLLKYHVVSGERILASAFKPTQELEMLAGGSTTVVKEGEILKINGVTILLPSVSADNGVIYTIDTVLTLKPDLPSTAPAYGGHFGTLLSTLLFLYHACL